LSNYDWSPLYHETSVDAAVVRLNVAVSQAIDLAIPSGYIKKHKNPAWFSKELKDCIKKNYFYKRYKKYKADSFMTNFIFCRKFVKGTIKTDIFRCLKSADKSPKSHSDQFWKYIPRLRKTNADVMRPEVSVAF
jgi:hypothetical protein